MIAHAIDQPEGLQKQKAERVVEPREEALDEQRQAQPGDRHLHRRGAHREHAAPGRRGPDVAVVRGGLGDVVLAGLAGPVDDAPLQALQVAAHQVAKAVTLVGRLGQLAQQRQQGARRPGLGRHHRGDGLHPRQATVEHVEPIHDVHADAFRLITDVERKNAEIHGFTVVDAASVLVTHLSESVKRHCHEILSRQDVQNLLDNLKQTHPTVVNELIPAQLSVGHVQRILQNLLAEGISIRNLAGILEKVSDYATVTKNPDELSEHARRALGAQITKPFQAENGGLRAITLDPRLEQQLAQGVRQSPTDISLAMEPKLARHIVETLSRHIQQMLAAGHPPVVLCAPHIRLAFHRFFQTTFAELNVLSYAEVPPRVEVQNAAMINLLCIITQISC